MDSCESILDSLGMYLYCYVQTHYSVHKIVLQSNCDTLDCVFSQGMAPGQDL